MFLSIYYKNETKYLLKLISQRKDLCKSIFLTQPNTHAPFLVLFKEFLKSLKKYDLY